MALTKEQIKLIDSSTHFHESEDWSERFARAIESAATAPLLERIAELEQQLLEARHALEGWANYDDWVHPESALEQSKKNTAFALAAIKGKR